MRHLRQRLAVAACVPVLLTAVAGCDIVTSDLSARESVEWRKTYDLQPGGRVEVININGRIDVTPSTGNTVEIVALKTARGGSPEAARETLERIEIVEAATADAVRIETRLPRGGGFLRRGGGEVRYTVKVPPASHLQVRTTNGGIEVSGVDGRVDAETTNGGIRARDVRGPIDASTTNGGVDVALTRVADGGVRLDCTNGGIRLQLPASARATISARVTNGGIDTGGLPLDVAESSRGRLQARLNGGGPNIEIEGTNGGIKIAAVE